MARTQSPNIEILELAAVALGPICDELVFLGGCAVGLLINASHFLATKLAVFDGRFLKLFQAICREIPIAKPDCPTSFQSLRDWPEPKLDQESVAYVFGPLFQGLTRQ